jgi:hypothetical protein
MLYDTTEGHLSSFMDESKSVIHGPDDSKSP